MTHAMKKGLMASTFLVLLLSGTSLTAKDEKQEDAINLSVLSAIAKDLDQIKEGLGDDKSQAGHVKAIEELIAKIGRFDKDISGIRGGMLADELNAKYVSDNLRPDPDRDREGKGHSMSNFKLFGD